MNRREAAKLVAVCLAACPGQSGKLDEQRQRAMVDAYASLLDDLTYEQANAAVVVLLQTRPYLPAIADIRATAVELTRGPIAAGGEQWGSVLRAVQYEGSYKAPGVDFVFHDAITARCVQALGWREICLGENPTATRARFIELYDQLARQAHREMLSPALASASEQRRLAATSAREIVEGLAKQLTSASKERTEGEQDAIDSALVEDVPF